MASRRVPEWSLALAWKRVRWRGFRVGVGVGVTRAERFGSKASLTCLGTRGGRIDVGPCTWLRFPCSEKSWVLAMSFRTKGRGRGVRGEASGPWTELWFSVFEFSCDKARRGPEKRTIERVFGVLRGFSCGGLEVSRVQVHDCPLLMCRDPIKRSCPREMRRTWADLRKPNCEMSVA